MGLNTFQFLRIAQHFFQDFDFEAHKADGFTSEIIQHEPSITRGKFNFYLRENIALVGRYRPFLVAEDASKGFNAYTTIRLCLYAGNPDLFSGMVTKGIRETFDAWRREPEPAPAAGG